MANRIFDLQETRGSFQVMGRVNGVASQKFYTSKKTKTGKDFRAVNFGCEYEGKKSVYLNLNGMPQDNVYFSKRDQKTGKTETKTVPWANRYKFKEDGFRMIGVNLGLEKTTDANGKSVNDKKTMTPFDACDYINGNLKDGASVFIKGNLDFSSYLDNDGNARRSIKYIPSQISLCKDVDFSEYNDDNKPTHDFTQQIVYMGIEKEKENDKETGRFVVSAKIIAYSDIVDTEFYITDSKLANLFRKNLKAYNAINVHGRIEVSHSVQEVVDEDDWGEKNPMNNVTAPTKVELIITGAAGGASIDKETYTEKNVTEAMKKVRAAKTAEQNFSGKTNASTTSEDDDWGEESDWGDDDDEELPF